MDATFRADADWLSTLLETIPDFVVVVDPDGIIRDINRVEAEYRMEEVLGQPIREFLDPRAQNAFDAALRAVFESEEDSAADAVIRTTGQAERWYRSRMFPLRRDGKTVAAMMLASNLEELTAADEELNRIRRLLPVCAWCNRIRSEDGEWESIGTYLQREMETDLSHGLCPACEGRWVEGSDPRG